MNFSSNNDYIDIHTHDCAHPGNGIFSVDSLLAHEEKKPLVIHCVRAWDTDSS